jgi:dipeptidyl aminopeptidase/acylaminoacyl peptidase
MTNERTFAWYSRARNLLTQARRVRARERSFRPRWFAILFQPTTEQGNSPTGSSRSNSDLSNCNTFRTFARTASRNLIRWLAVLISGLSAATSGSVHAGQASHAKRAATVVDAILMTKLADPLYLNGGSSNGQVAQYSPDGKHFAVVLLRGNLERDTTEYSLLLYRTSQVLRSPKADVVLTMSSSSNREAIKGVRWLDDNETIVFLGERPGESSQVYRLNIKTKSLERLTQHQTTLINYDISADGREIAYIADPPARKIDNEKTRREGVVVKTQTLPVLLAGDCAKPTAIESKQLFVKIGADAPLRVTTFDFVESLTPLSLSPDGRYLAFEVLAKHVPRLWDRYQDTLVHMFTAEVRQQDAPEYSGPIEYMLFDTKERKLEDPLEAPRNSRLSVTWSPDGSSLVIPGAYLPLDVSDVREEEARERNTYTVEVNLPSKKITKIMQDTGKLYSAKWHGARGLTLSSIVGNEPKAIFFQRDGDGWRKSAEGGDASEAPARLSVELQEDMNHPPKIYVSDPTDGHKALLLDLNPQFHDLSFGDVEAVSWTSSDGTEWEGGLFLPPAYVPGERYPLIIQTHGFDQNKFYIDGPYSSSFAAQPFAGKGFVVLQVGALKSPRSTYSPGSVQEVALQMSAYTGGIDYLDGRGLIDKKRVGIIGFSRTVWAVSYTLTHSAYDFGAATFADGIDAGYFSYLALKHLQPAYDLMNGGVPYGEGMAQWLKNSPSFNLEKIHTPIRLEPHGPLSLLLEWEWFSGLSHLQKPVELIYLPDADHVPVKPRERMISQQGDVDWFCFWLKGEEDPDPDKKDQYSRWRKLRQEYAANIHAVGSSQLFSER